MMRDYLISWQTAEGFRVDLYDTGTLHHDGPQQRLAYVFRQDGNVIFRGADYGCSPMHAIDSAESVSALLGFLSLRPGDTDAEYFADYTPDQCAWRDEYAETLGLYALDDDETRAEVATGMFYDEPEPAYGYGPVGAWTWPAGTDA